jgi:hypothetical protein
MLQMVMHVCSMAQDIAENWCERNHQEQEGKERRDYSHYYNVSSPARLVSNKK